MKRRALIKSIIPASLALSTFPAWAYAWKPNELSEGGSFFTKAEQDFIQNLVATLIPEGQLPGGVGVGAHLFVDRMVTDCYEPAYQTLWRQTLSAMETAATEKHQTGFARLSSEQKEALLEAFLKHSDPSYRKIAENLKNLSVQSYLNSEYVLTNFYNYEMAPGHFHGCVPVSSK
jgi:hypothetical protein